jgi:hypothetical protein
MKCVTTKLQGITREGGTMRNVLELLRSFPITVAPAACTAHYLNLGLVLTTWTTHVLSLPYVQTVTMPRYTVECVEVEMY